MDVSSTAATKNVASKNRTLDHEYIIFCFVIVAIVLLRASLVGRGLTSLVDEYRYFQTLDAVKHFAEGSIREGVVSLNSTQGRPGDAIIRLFPAFIQAVMFKAFGINTNTPFSLATAAWMNWVVLIVNLILFQKISKIFFEDRWSRVAVILYASLVNSSIYLRHILPYDIAICFFLLALLLTLRNREDKVSNKQLPIFKIGFISGLSFVVYPGYFLVPLILVLMTVEFPLGARVFLRLVVRVMAFSVGFISVILLMELIARLGGMSYIISSKTLSSTITQGDFSEGYSFVFLYLIKVERVLGAIMLVLLVWSVASLPRAIGMVGVSINEFQARRVLLTLALIASWFFYASLVFFANKMVFYGRILHLFIPLLILVGIHGVASIKGSGARYFLITVSFSSFLIFLVDYFKVVYVKDAAFASKIYSPLPGLLVRSNTACGDESFVYEPFQSKYKNETGGWQAKANNTLLLVNFGFLYPIRCSKPAVDVLNRGLIVQGNYMGKYPAYQFEGYNERERQLLTTKDFQFRIYSIDTGASRK